MDIFDIEASADRDKKRLRAKEKILREDRVIPNKYLRNMWQVYDLSTPGNDYSEEHHKFLMVDPVFAMMQHIRDITVDGSGDPRRELASDIMVLMRDRKLEEGFYLALYQMVSANPDEKRLLSYMGALSR